MSGEEYRMRDTGVQWDEKRRLAMVAALIVRPETAAPAANAAVSDNVDKDPGRTPDQPYLA